MGKRMSILPGFKEAIAVILLIITLVIMVVAGCHYINTGYTPMVGRMCIVGFVMSFTGYLFLASGSD